MKHTSTYEVIGEYNRNESSTQSNYRNTIHPSQSKMHDNASVSDRLFRIAGYNRRRDAPPQGDNSSQSDSQSSKVKNRGGYRQNSPNQRARSKSGIETFRTRRWNRLNNENSNVPHFSSERNQVSCLINSIETEVMSPGLALSDVRAAVLSKIKLIDDKAKLVSVKEDCARSDNKSCIFVLQLSTCLDISELVKMPLRRGWSVEAFYSPTVSPRSKSTSKVSVYSRV